MTACSMEARRRRIATATQRRRGKGNLGVRLLWTASARFLAVDDEDDVGERLGQGGVATRAHWPRELTAMATAARVGTFPDDCEKRRRGNGGGACPGGSWGLSYRVSGTGEVGAAGRRPGHGGGATATEEVEEVTGAGGRGGGPRWAVAPCEL